MARDWDVAAYAHFRDLRLRPALDLLGSVPALGSGDVIDLGCGNGAAAQALGARFGDRRIIGVDASAAMLAQAGGYAATVRADIADWTPDTPPALIFSNAVLHWLGDHAGLLPRLASLLAPGGVLAVQMPRQFDAPSHRLLRETASALFPQRFSSGHATPPVHPAEFYWRLLSPCGQVSIWETEYLQHLPAVDTGHPVRAFTASTAARPVLDRLSPDETHAFYAAYDAGLADAYPVMADGSVLMPFRRLFSIVVV